jgi:Flp pilus assembly protein protease CpaA
MLLEMTMVLLGVSVAGFGLAGYWDLKTTEFPDWLPYVMIALALGIRGVFSLMTGDFSYIIYSTIIGLGFLGFGLALYWLKQWGDGDAWLLGALGFLWPDSGSFAVAVLLPFPLTLLFNFFFLAFFYLLVYSVFLGLRSRDVSGGFLKELGGAGREIGRLVGAFTLACLGLMFWVAWQFGVQVWSLLYILAFPPLLLSVLVFMRYGRFVEGNLFKKRVPASRLRAGDVLVKDRWRGLTEKEVAALRKRGGHVWIKEGVRFAPVFVITVVVTLLWGNLLMALV